MVCLPLSSDVSIFAVKTTFPSFGDSSSANAFKNEIQSAAKVRGENVISYEYVHDGETFLGFPPYIIMEYANGGTLRSTLEELIKNHTMLENVVLIDFFKQLASGMEDINRVLVHRDIKPDNILKCGSTWKISDFGLAKIAVEEHLYIWPQKRGILARIPSKWIFTLWELSSTNWLPSIIPTVHLLSQTKNVGRHICIVQLQESISSIQRCRKV